MTPTGAGFDQDRAGHDTGMVVATLFLVFAVMAVVLGEAVRTACSRLVAAPVRSGDPTSLGAHAATRGAHAGP